MKLHDLKGIDKVSALYATLTVLGIYGAISLIIKFPVIIAQSIYWVVTEIGPYVLGIGCAVILWMVAYSSYKMARYNKANHNKSTAYNEKY